MPNGIALVKDGPNADLAAQLIDAFLGEEYQSLLAGVLNSNPVNPKATVPETSSAATNLFRPDWAYIAENRAGRTDRWSRERFPVDPRSADVGHARQLRATGAIVCPGSPDLLIRGRVDELCVVR